MPSTDGCYGYSRRKKRKCGQHAGTEGEVSPFHPPILYLYYSGDMNFYRVGLKAIIRIKKKGIRGISQLITLHERQEIFHTVHGTESYDLSRSTTTRILKEELSKLSKKI